MARRRANQEGTIFYRESRRKWVAEVTLNGRRITKYANSQRECRDWIHEMRIKIGKGLTFTGTQVTLEKFAKTWLAGKELSLRSGTIDQYRQIVEQHILPTIGKMRLQDISPAHLKHLYLAKKEAGEGARTVQMIHAVMYNMLKRAMKEGVLGRNPADAVERPKVEETERRILSEEQARQLVIATMDKRLGTLIYLALITSMREGELLGLKWSDLDWKKGQLHVQRQVQRITGEGLVFVPPKTKAGQRKIKLGQGALERLAAHRSEQELLKAAQRERWEENDLIFPNNLGRPMGCENMISEFKQLLAENGLPKIRFHDLRHTSISFLLDSGTPVNTVQKRAGHSKASVTTDTYGHSLARAEEEAAERIEEMITPVPVPVAVKSLSK